jgi:uncharacterized protein YlxW (UPF0749 family)
VRSRSGQIAIAALALALGFLVVVQFRTQATAGGLADLSAGDLTTLIVNLNARNQQLATEEATLRARLSDLQTSGTQHAKIVASIRDELSRLQRWAGFDPVRGRGVRITIQGPIGAHGLNDLINELRSAGAEAIAIEDVRITEADVVADLPDGLGVENRALDAPITMWAIGNPQVVSASLTRVGGIIGRIQVSQPDVTIAVAPQDVIDLPATGRPPGPRTGRPTL